MAEVLFCDPINEYTFRWSLSDETLGNEISKLSGKILQFPTDFFASETLVNVEVKVLNKNSEVMGSVS